MSTAAARKIKNKQIIDSSAAVGQFLNFIFAEGSSKKTKNVEEDTRELSAWQISRDAIALSQTAEENVCLTQSLVS